VREAAQAHWIRVVFSQGAPFFLSVRFHEPIQAYVKSHGEQTK